MAIRIGPSCALKPSMVIDPCSVVETRRFIDLASGWYEISKKCIAEKKFLIVTLCIDKNGKLEYVPSEQQWRNFVEATILQLQSIGANKWNCRIDVINEPMKYISKEKYAEFINITYSQVNKRFLVGAGCDELVYMDMYQFISSHAQFNTLVVHIQGACNNEENTSRLTNQALNLAISYKRPIDCNEANYNSIDTKEGYEKLLMNLRYAEKINCANFPIVFMNLDKSAFSVNTDRWERLSFFVNGKLHSSYWNDFKSKIEAKAPIPNIFIPIIINEDDDMKLKVLKVGSKGNQVYWLQEILEEEYGFENAGGYDGIYGGKTLDQIKAYQNTNALVPDGVVGKFTMVDLIVKATNKTPDYWKTKLQIYMSYE